MKPREIQKDRGGESASVQVPRNSPAQRLPDRAGVPPELDSYDDVAKEPLEQQAFEDAGLALEALTIGKREPLFLNPDPEEVGAPGDPLGEGRGDPTGRCLDALIIAPESLNPSHSGPPPAPERACYLRGEIIA
jgi:hypothetical protein